MNTEKLNDSVPLRYPARARLRLQRGVTSIEYALVGALIAMVIVGTVTTLGLTMNDFYSFISDEVAKATPSGS